MCVMCLVLEQRPSVHLRLGVCVALSFQVFSPVEVRWMDGIGLWEAGLGGVA